MLKNNVGFYPLITQVMQLEVMHETLQEEYNHLYYLYTGFGKDNANAMNSAKYQYERAEKEIDELIKEISELKLDNDMQKYYKLYNQRKELLKDIWTCETEIGYIGSKLLFDCTCDDQVDRKIAKKRKQFENKKKVANDKMKEVVLEMKEIYSA